MTYCYSNNGLSMRAVDSSYVPQTGEVLFSTTPTTDQLAAAFPGYVAAVTAQKLSAYKAQRDSLLTATDTAYSCNDYTVDGNPLTTDQRTELKTYRQALRDAPEKSYPNWPTKPSWLP